MRTARFDADAATIPGLDDPVATREASVIHRPRMHARVRARSSEDNNIKKKQNKRKATTTTTK